MINATHHSGTPLIATPRGRTVHTTTSTPWGEFALVGTQTEHGLALTHLRPTSAFNTTTTADKASVGEPALPGDRDDAAFAAVNEQLAQYIAGERATFDVQMAPPGTVFQRDVWASLLDIQPGDTTTYGAIAEQLGRPTAARAVGTAVGANTIAILIPCHRVIGKGGAITGYAWGLDMKRDLLAREGVTV